MNDLLPTAPVAPDSGRWKPVQRGFPERTEVLTEVGWVDIAAFYSSDFLGEAIPFKGNGRNAPGYAPKELEWGQWNTLSSFPRLGTVNPSTGDIVFVRPKRFIYYRYDGRLFHLKMKGVDVLSTLHSDFWLKAKYGRSWKFILADDVVRNIHGSANYMLLNKFNRDMYGLWSPERDLGNSVSLKDVDGSSIEGIGSDIKCFVDAPIVVYPKKHVKRRRIWDLFFYESKDAEGNLVKADRVRTDVPCFNVDIAPYHNLIIRRGRKDDNPRTLWIGGPVVVGDGLDKSELRVAGVLGAASLGSNSYSPLRPDYRSVSSDILFEKD
jgi:hypothetical protein